jgi:hypothetical protein
MRFHFAAFQLHRVLQAALAVGVLANRGALRAVGAQVEGAVPAGLLADPDAVRLTSAITVQPTEQCVQTDFLSSEPPRFEAPPLPAAPVMKTSDHFEGLRLHIHECRTELADAGIEN